jgi:predicted amidophosphoribosyltransferase
MFLAVQMAALLPVRTAALVPVPRVLARRAMYGIDQTRLLAEAVGHLTGIPVIHALRAPVWEPRSAGKRRSDRSVATFTAVRSVPTGLVLVDDVCTTGRTVIGAARTLGLSSVPVVVATSAGIMGVRIGDSPTKEVA